MRFHHLAGHQPEKNGLINLVQKNRVSHALLLLGKEGSGALELAIAFAQYLMCEEVQASTAGNSLFGEGPRTDSCGTCASCIKVQKLIHPDLHFSYPVLRRNTKHDKSISTDYIASWRLFLQNHPFGNVREWLDFLRNSKDEKIDSPANKQGNIAVSECDDIVRKLSLKPFENRYKVMILWMPEFLGNNGNRLLKLIEEPPANTVFLFVANEEELILPTILSRTQMLRIKPFTTQDVLEELDRKGVERERAKLIASLCEGDMGMAMNMVTEELDDRERLTRQWLNVIYTRNVKAQLAWIDEVAGMGRDKQKQLLDFLVHLLQQAMRLRFLQDESKIPMAANARDFAHRINQMCSPEAQEAMVVELEKAEYYISRNANAKLLFHALSIKLYYIIKDNSLILVL